MAGRRLSTEEAALWSRVTATVRALVARKPDAAGPIPTVEAPAAIRPRPLAAARPTAPARASDRAIDRLGETLDGGWDKRLRQGAVAPDRSIDLHGHTLDSAHSTLDHALERAIADDVRLLLVVTGRAPNMRDGAPRRGLIRASIGDWLAASRHAGRIAAIRNAHPRHGGAGALYVILRRRRS